MILASDKLSSASCLRIALVAYRDHPPQDHTWLLKTFPFTSDVNSVRENLKTLYASGGGDGPEASTAALNALTELDWRPDASKMALLITDAPPHGIGVRPCPLRHADSIRSMAMACASRCKFELTSQPRRLARRRRSAAARSRARLARDRPLRRRLRAGAVRLHLRDRVRTL